jgi:hypothetical protein
MWNDLRRGGWCAAALALFTTGCLAVAPLDEVQGRARDNGSDAGAGDSDAGREVDLDGDAAGRCEPTAMNGCDPAACGCSRNQRCIWGGAMARAICFDPPAVPERAPGAAGERCTSAAECEVGTSCGEPAVCSIGCITNNDCGGDQCHLQADDSRVCLRRCDPVGGGDCEPQTTCVPTSDQTLVQHAFCAGVKSDMVNPTPSGVGEPCRYSSDCADGLGCIETPAGPTCTPWCRTHADCPAAQLCSGAGLSAHARRDDPVGLCDACDGVLPSGWIGRPVWTLQEFQDCQVLCPDDDLACIAAMCPGGDRFLECFGLAASECAGQPQGPCRSEYEALSCCVASACRVSTDQAACLTEQCSGENAAWQSCSANEDCLGSVAAACVGQP